MFQFRGVESPWTKYFYDYHVIWYSEDPYIEFVGDDFEAVGKMTLDGTGYHTCIGALGSTIHLADLYFYDYNKHGNNISDNYLIWK